MAWQGAQATLTQVAKEAFPELHGTSVEHCLIAVELAHVHFHAWMNRLEQ